MVGPTGAVGGSGEVHDALKLCRRLGYLFETGLKHWPWQLWQWEE